MSITDLAVAVFIGNIVTVAFLWCAREADRHKRDADIPWWSLAGLCLPLIVSALALI